MIPGRRACKARPDGLKPLFVVLVGYDRKHARRDGGFSISAGLALHQYEFDIVLDDRVGLIGFS